MAQDWNIRPRSGVCCGCERGFADREVCMSVLRREEEGFGRFDYCEACWGTNRFADAVFSSWSGEFHEPEPPEAEALKKETAESLLRRLIEDGDAANENVIYILAVMLERQRILVERDLRKLEDGSLLRVYERRKSGETFLVHDPQLELNALTDVQNQVVAMLGQRDVEDQAAAAKESQGDTAADAVPEADGSEAPESEPAEQAEAEVTAPQVGDDETSGDAPGGEEQEPRQS